MDHLDALTLPEIRIFNRWTDAPKGALLQMMAGDHIVVGMRTTFKAANGEPNALLVLSGHGPGELITDAYLDGPALDVSDKFEIAAVEPAPVESVNFGKLPAGALLRHTQKPGTFFVWFVMGDSKVSGAICVASDIPDCDAGDCFPQLSKNAVLVVAKRVTVAPKE